MAIGDVVNTRTPSMAAPRTSPLYMICRKGLSQRSPLWGVRPKAHQPLVAGHAFWPAMAALFPPAEAVRILAAAGVGASMATGNPLHRCLPCMVAHWALPLDTIGASSRHRHRILFCAHPHCHHPLVACHAPRPAMTTRSPPAEALRPGVAAGVWTSATNGNLRHNRVPCMVAVPTTPHEASTRGACNRHSLFGGTRPHRHHPPRARNAIRPTLRTRGCLAEAPLLATRRLVQRERRREKIGQVGAHSSAGRCFSRPRRSARPSGCSVLGMRSRQLRADQAKEGSARRRPEGGLKADAPGVK